MSELEPQLVDSSKVNSRTYSFLAYVPWKRQGSTSLSSVMVPLMDQLNNANA